MRINDRSAHDRLPTLEFTMKKVIRMLFLLSGILGSIPCGGMAQVIIGNTASVTDVVPLGVAVGTWSYWGGSAAYLQNILQNPGYEMSTGGHIDVVPSIQLTSQTFCDANNYTEQAPGFYDGPFQDDYVTNLNSSSAHGYSRGVGIITQYDPSGFNPPCDAVSSPITSWSVSGTTDTINITSANSNIPYKGAGGGDLNLGLWVSVSGASPTNCNGTFQLNGYSSGTQFSIYNPNRPPWCSGGSVNAGSGPGYKYRASFMIKQGDFIKMHERGNTNSLGLPYRTVEGWWVSDPAYRTIADNEPNSNGFQALELVLNGSTHNFISYNDNCNSAGCYASPSANVQNFLLVNGQWRASIWVKCVSCSADAAVQLKFARGSTIFLNRSTNISANSSWTRLLFNFMGTETSLYRNVNNLTFTISGSGASGHIRFDDAFLGPSSSSCAPWTTQVVDVLNKIKPGVLRSWESENADSFANWRADLGARGSYNYAGASTFGWGYSLDDFMKLNSCVGSTPYITMPIPLTDLELTSVGKYLQREEGIHNFRSIYIEFGDEQWNAGSCGGVCTSTNEFTYTAFDQREISVIRSGYGSGSSVLKFIAGGQYGTNGGGGPIGAALVANNLGGFWGVNGAPYFWWCDDTGKGSATYLSDMYSDPALAESKIAGYISSSSPLQLSFYESGPSSWWGTMTNAERNPIIAGAGSATVDGELAINGWTAGLNMASAWNLAQQSFSNSTSWSNGLCTYSDAPPSNYQAYMWGIVKDFFTPLIRPRGLAIEMINNDFIQDLTGSFYPANSNSYSGIYVGVWMSAAHGPNLLIANTNVASQTIKIDFPNGWTPPSLAYEIKYTNSITDENENTADVSIGTGPSVIHRTNGVTLTVPAYGLVVVR